MYLRILGHVLNGEEMLERGWSDRFYVNDRLKFEM
jgi:hypothetical protein